VHSTGCKGKKGVDVQRRIETRFIGKDSEMGFMIIGLFFAILSYSIRVQREAKEREGR
jgi:hypothetical protein